MLVRKLEEVLPDWMLELKQWRAYAGAIALGLDAFIEGVVQLATAPHPGQTAYAPEHGGFPNLDALPYIGRDRGLVRGLLEGPERYAYRCRHWREAWRRSSLGFGMLEQLQALTQPSPVRVRVVSAGGVWHTLEPDGTRILHHPAGYRLTVSPDGTSAADAVAVHPWDWDSETEVSPQPLRVWPILYCPIPGLVDDDEGIYGDASTWYGDGGLIGLTTTLPFLEQVRAVARAWTAEGVDVPWIILAFDAASFDPETPGPYPGAGMPDGWWEEGVKPNPGDPTQLIEARLETARYLPGASDDGTVPDLG